MVREIIQERNVTLSELYDSMSYISLIQYMQVLIDGLKS